MTNPLALRPSTQVLLVLAGLVLLAGLGVWASGFLDRAAPAAWPDRAWWLQQFARWQAWQGEAPLVFLLGFMLLFTLLSALALPGCAALALLAGSSFGGLTGTLLVGLASTLGALLSFLAARHWAQDRVRRRLGNRLVAVDRALSRHGRLGVFWLRLLPVVPYPLLNPLLGLSKLSVAGFFWPSLLGLTLGSAPYVWAGHSLPALLAGVAATPAWSLAGAAGLLLAGAIGLRRWRRRSLGAGR